MKKIVIDDTKRQKNIEKFLKETKKFDTNKTTKKAAKKTTKKK